MSANDYPEIKEANIIITPEADQPEEAGEPAALTLDFADGKVTVRSTLRKDQLRNYLGRLSTGIEQAIDVLDAPRADGLVAEGIRHAMALADAGQHRIGHDSDVYQKILLPASKGELDPNVKIFDVELTTTLQYDKSILEALKAGNEFIEDNGIQFFLARLSAFNVANLMDCPWLLNITLRNTSSRPVPM